MTVPSRMACAQRHQQFRSLRFLLARGGILFDPNARSHYASAAATGESYYPGPTVCGCLRVVESHLLARVGIALESGPPDLGACASICTTGCDLGRLLAWSPFALGASVCTETAV